MRSALTLASLGVREGLRLGGGESGGEGGDEGAGEGGGEGSGEGGGEGGGDEEEWAGVRSAAASLVVAEAASLRGAVLPRSFGAEVLPSCDEEEGLAASAPCEEQHPGQASQQVMRHHLLVECQTLLQHSHLHIACKQSKKEQFLR